MSPLAIFLLGLALICIAAGIAGAVIGWVDRQSAELDHDDDWRGI